MITNHLKQLMKGPHPPELFALLGQPVIGNPTQYMIEQALADLGLGGRYLSIEVKPEDLGDAIKGLRAMHFTGAHITLPHKVTVISYLDELSDEARKIGAVNCLYWRNDKLVGENTDGKGFLNSIEKVLNPSGKRVIILGAGGAARSIGVELGKVGVHQLIVVNRSPKRGLELVDHLNKIGIPSEYSIWKGEWSPPSEVDILINATSIGLNQPEQRVPINFSALRKDTLVADVVFNPPRTRFLREAHTAGLPTLDGLGMLVNQGVIAFQLWTGKDPNIVVMRKAIEEAFSY